MMTKVFLGPESRYVAAVADGMGGYDEGEVASEYALHSLSDFYAQLPNGLSYDDLMDVVSEWGTRVHQQVNDDAAAAGLIRGTTLVSLLFYEDKSYFLNCGDSRIYRFRDGVLNKLSNDHDLTSITGNEADSHIVVNCIGANADSCYIDCMELTGRVFDGDIYLLCSDGLSDMCSDAEIESGLNAGFEANEMVNMALDKGGLDNVSVIVIKVNIK